MGAAEKLPHLFTEEEASAYLKKSIITLRRWRKAGRLGCTKIGNSFRFTERHLIECLESETARAKAVKPTCLYRHFDEAGTLLYVGISMTLAWRVSQHRSNSKWFQEVALITVQWFQDEASARDAETVAIRDERPVYNVQGVK